MPGGEAGGRWPRRGAAGSQRPPLRAATPPEDASGPRGGSVGAGQRWLRARGGPRLRPLRPLPRGGRGPAPPDGRTARRRPLAAGRCCRGRSAPGQAGAGSGCGQRVRSPSPVSGVSSSGTALLQTDRSVATAGRRRQESSGAAAPTPGPPGLGAAAAAGRGPGRCV